MRLYFFLIVMLLLFSSCSPLNAESISSPVPTEQSLSTSTEIYEEFLIATERAKASIVKTELALTIAAQPTFTPWPTFTPTLANLPTLTPIANSTPAQVGAFFDVFPDVLGPRYEIENACYFDTQSGWERHEIYAGAIAGSGDEYSSQGVVVIRILQVKQKDSKANVQLTETSEYLTLKKLGSLRLPSFGNCGDNWMILTTPLNFGWFLNPLSEEFYQYEGSVPLARLEVGKQTQLAEIGSYCWMSTCADGPGISTSSAPLIIQSSKFAHLTLPLDKAPDGLTLFAMLVSPSGSLQYEYLHGESADWSYETPGRERLDLGTLPSQREQDIKFPLDPGYYVLTILAVWHDYGDVKYGFLLEVRE